MRVCALLSLSIYCCLVEIDCNSIYLSNKWFLLLSDVLLKIEETTHKISLCFSRVYSVFPPIPIWQRLMDTKKSRLRSPSPSSSRSPISENEKGSVSPSARRGPSTPLQSSAVPRHDSDEEHDPTDRDLLTLGDESKAMLDETSSNVVSDTDENQEKKRAHHRHHHHRRHHKQAKSNKRSASHQRHSAKRR